MESPLSSLPGGIIAIVWSFSTLQNAPNSRLHLKNQDGNNELLPSITGGDATNIETFQFSLSRLYKDFPVQPQSPGTEVIKWRNMTSLTDAKFEGNVAPRPIRRHWKKPAGNWAVCKRSSPGSPAYACVCVFYLSFCLCVCVCASVWASFFCFFSCRRFGGRGDEWRSPDLHWHGTSRFAFLTFCKWTNWNSKAENRALCAKFKHVYSILLTISWIHNKP